MKNFLVSKNLQNRVDFVKKIKGKKIAIYNVESEILKEFDLCIDMHKLMKGDYFLENLAKCDGNTTVVLIDVLIKHGIYVHPYGKIFAFTEQSKETFIIDSFAFKWDEKQIVRPFLFIDPNLLGSSMINFFEGKENTLENYAEKIKPYISIDVEPLEIQIVKYKPTEKEIEDYNNLKHKLIEVDKYPKPKIVNELIKYVDNLGSKKECFKSITGSGLLVSSNKSKNKFWIYEMLRNELIKKVCFFSSGIFGADEIELKKTLTAIERHNKLIHLING